MRLHNRIIKATFWRDPELLQWPRDKRWFYEGLVQLADDSGCLENSPFAFKIELFPSPVDADITLEVLSGWVEELIRDRKLIPYEANGKECLYMVNFHKHQTLKNCPPPDTPLPPWVIWEPFKSNESSGKYSVDEEVLSKFLDSSYQSLSNVLEPSSNLTKPNLEPEPNLSKPEVDTCASDDARLCTAGQDSGGIVEAEKVTATPDEQPETKSGPRSPFRSKRQEQLFDEFWAQHPKKRSKGQAEKAWVKLAPDGELFAAIMSGLARAKTSTDWQKDGGQYIPYPASWLNAKGWLDEYQPVRAGPKLSANVEKGLALVEKYRQLEEQERRAAGYGTQ